MGSVEGLKLPRLGSKVRLVQMWVLGDPEMRVSWLLSCDSHREKRSTSNLMMLTAAGQVLMMARSTSPGSRERNEDKIDLDLSVYDKRRGDGEILVEVIVEEKAARCSVEGGASGWLLIWDATLCYGKTTRSGCTKVHQRGRCRHHRPQAKVRARS